MESFPSKELPPELSLAVFGAYQDGLSFVPPEWLQAFLGIGPAEPPERSLTAEERIAGLAAVWSEAKYNFAYWDQLPGEEWWDKQFIEFLPRVSGAASDAEYWTLLQLFARLLGDGHTSVYPPRHLSRAEARPPLRILSMEGRPVVVEGDALPPGTEIIAVDGRPSAEVRAERARTLASSTAHFTAAVTASGLLFGPAGTSVTVTARLPGGEVREVVLSREGSLPKRPPVRVRDLGEGILHVEVNTMESHETATRFHERFSDFDGVRGLALDLRWNSGGASVVGFSILARLLSEPVPSSAERLRTYIPTIRAWGGSQRWLVLPGNPVTPDEGRARYTGPVAVLSSPLTGSAAEDFLVAYKGSRRGPVVGEPSCGSTGQPLFTQLPGGGFLRVCTKRDTFPDGTPFVGRGVEPDIACAPTLAGIAAGRDEVLERAVAWLDEGRTAIE